LAVAAFGLGSMMILAMMADAGMKSPELAEKAMLGYFLSLALAGSCGLTLGLGILLTRHPKKLLVVTLVQVLVSVLLAAAAVAIYFKAVAG
jgi:uncharacterized membrane protein YczE